MQRSRSIREVLEALEWVRREMMHHGSPDFIRQRELEGRVHQLAGRLARSDQLQVANEKRQESEDSPTLSPNPGDKGGATSQRKTERHGKRGGTLPAS